MLEVLPFIRGRIADQVHYKLAEADHLWWKLGQKSVAKSIKQKVDEVSYGLWKFKQQPLVQHSTAGEVGGVTVVSMYAALHMLALGIGVARGDISIEEPKPYVSLNPCIQAAPNWIPPILYGGSELDQVLGSGRRNVILYSTNENWARAMEIREKYSREYPGSQIVVYVKMANELPSQFEDTPDRYRCVTKVAVRD